MDEYARALLAKHPEVEEVIVFGSFADDTYSPGSDLDVFIVLREASDSPRERIPRFLPDKSLDVPVDVFPFTRAEMEERRDSPLLLACTEKPLAISAIRRRWLLRLVKRRFKNRTVALRRVHSTARCRSVVDNVGRGWSKT